MSLTLSQQDLGLMPTAVWNSGKIRISQTIKGTVQNDSLWKLSPSQHLVYAQFWMPPSTVGTRSASRSPVSLIAPNPMDYRVKNVLGQTVSSWGNDMEGNGIDVSLHVTPKCRGSQRDCSYWSKISWISSDLWFRDNGRLCRPSTGSSVRSVGNCGVGTHTIEIGYGKPGSTANITWLASKNFLMLPQNALLYDIEKKRESPSNVFSKNFFSHKLATNLYGAAGTWSAPGGQPKTSIPYLDTQGKLQYAVGWGFWNGGFTAPDHRVVPPSRWVPPVKNVDESFFSTLYSAPIKGFILTENGDIIINKNDYFSGLAASIKRGPTKGYVPVNMIFKTNNINHCYTLWLVY